MMPRAEVGLNLHSCRAGRRLGGEGGGQEVRSIRALLPAGCAMLGLSLLTVRWESWGRREEEMSAVPELLCAPWKQALWPPFHGRGLIPDIVSHLSPGARPQPLPSHRPGATGRACIRSEPQHSMGQED